jgi:L-ascorbate metabolism protein UlaG (beta-lactamase superfamily)
MARSGSRRAIARRVLGAAALALVLAVAWLVYRLRDHPSMEPYARLELHDAAKPGDLSVTFLGVSTLLVTNGETALLTDGFFTRPGILDTTVGKIAPDRRVIAHSLERAGIGKLAAIFVVHSHYDHAMDAPEVARITGGLVVGSESTANVARGAGLAEDRIRVVRPGEPMGFGRFRVTMIGSRHFPHGMAMGEIKAPLVPPARATDYLEGGSYSVLIEHGGRSLLVQSSAGSIEGALASHHADVVLLGIAGLGTRDGEYRRTYWRDVVEAVGARRVIPIHYDDFTLPLDQPLRPMPRLLDDFEASMRFLLKSEKGGLDIRMLPVWQPVDPFAGLG